MGERCKETKEDSLSRMIPQQSRNPSNKRTRALQVASIGTCILLPVKEHSVTLLDEDHAVSNRRPVALLFPENANRSPATAGDIDNCELVGRIRCVLLRRRIYNRLGVHNTFGMR